MVGVKDVSGYVDLKLGSIGLTSVDNINLKLYYCLTQLRDFLASAQVCLLKIFKQIVVNLFVFSKNRQINLNQICFLL